VVYDMPAGGLVRAPTGRRLATSSEAHAGALVSGDDHSLLDEPGRWSTDMNLERC
jgi:hypothetical protein